MEDNIVLIAHPGKQHVFQLLEGVKRSGLKIKFLTTVYDKEGSITYSFKKFLKGNNLKKASSRKSDNLTSDEIHLFCELGGLLLIFLGRLGLNKLIMDYFYRLVHKRFAKKTAEFAIKFNIKTVVMFDSNVFDCFKLLKKCDPNIKCILDVTIASRICLKEIYERDIAATQSRELFDEQKYLWNNRNLQRYASEFIQSDYLLVGSSFVKNSITKTNNKFGTIELIPYGVDLQKFTLADKSYLEGPLRLFFVGGINRRKGIHHLLNVVSKYSKDEVMLTLAGAYNSTSDLFSNYKDTSNINFAGFVTRDLVADFYAKSHVFVLPSLGEGLALVGLEALASGLPLLCTENTGVNDLIVDGENGFVVSASNPDALKQKIDWFLDNRGELEQMSAKARESVANYSWTNYYNKIGTFFKTLEN